MVDISGSYDEQAEPSSFDRLPPFTDQRAKIIDSDVIDISNQSNMGRCLNLTWQIETGPLDGRIFWQRINLWAENMNNLDKVIQIANSQFAAIREATGKKSPRDTQELHHIPCLVSYGPQKKNPDYDEVKSVKAISGGNSGGVSANSGRRPAPAASNNSRQAPGSSGQRSAPWPARGQAQRQEEDIPF